MHTFEEIRTRTPANPKEAALEAVIPQAVWEALLQDAVQGLCPPYTSQTLCLWLHPPDPRRGPSAPHKPPPNATTTTPGMERGQAGDGKGHPRKGARKDPT